MAKATKNRKNLFHAIKIVLTIALGFICYFQFKTLNSSCLSVSIEWHFIPFFAMLLLMPVNYFCEWKKWKSVTHTISIDLGAKTNFQAFMAGIITGMLTPNMQGNFLGRMYYFPRRHRIPIILLTIWSNLAQFIIAILFGLLSILVIGISYSFIENDFIHWILLFIAISLMIFYFTFERWGFGFQRMKWFSRMRKLLKENFNFRIEQLVWGTLRYLIFSVQFLLAFMAFGADFSWEMYFLVFQIYLWTTLAPSLILGKLVIRESIAIWVMASIGLDNWNVIAASLSIWIINLLIPTLSGIVICKQKTAEI